MTGPQPEAEGSPIPINLEAVKAYVSGKLPKVKPLLLNNGGFQKITGILLGNYLWNEFTMPKPHPHILLEGGIYENELPRSRAARYPMSSRA